MAVTQAFLNGSCGGWIQPCSERMGKLAWGTINHWRIVITKHQGDFSTPYVLYKFLSVQTFLPIYILLNAGLFAHP